jgi:ADP-ribose diphosphatase
MSKNYKLISSTIDYRCKWFSIIKEKLIYPNGFSNTTYKYTRPGDFIGVLALDKNNKIIVLKQWRSMLKTWNYEFPMGGMDKNETHLKAAKREFFEETGYKAKKWDKLGKLHLAPGTTDQIGVFYLATDLVKITGKAEDNPAEIIKVEKFTIDQINTMIKKGEFTDGPSISILYLYLNKINKLNK